MRSDNPVYKSLSRLVDNNILDIENIWDTAHHSNWGELANIPEEETDKCGPSEGIPGRKGMCVYALEDNCILPNGDVTICGWFDIMRRMIVGNVFTQSMEEIFGKGSLYEKILNDQKNGIYTGICRFCTLSGNPRLKELGYEIKEEDLENPLPRYTRTK